MASSKTRQPAPIKEVGNTGHVNRRRGRRSAELVIGKVTFVENAVAEHLLVREILALCEERKANRQQGGGVRHTRPDEPTEEKVVGRGAAGAASRINRKGGRS